MGGNGHQIFGGFSKGGNTLSIRKRYWKSANFPKRDVQNLILIPIQGTLVPGFRTDSHSIADPWEGSTLQDYSLRLDVSMVIWGGSQTNSHSIADPWKMSPLQNFSLKIDVSMVIWGGISSPASAAPSRTDRLHLRVGRP